MDEETRRRQNAFQRWPPPRRSSGNFRLYEEAHRERLMLIRQCRVLDMILEEIHQLLTQGSFGQALRAGSTVTRAVPAGS